MTRFLRWLLPYKDIGWTEIGEEFTRFQLVKTRWGNVYLHRLWCPNTHPNCHDHPWSFWTLLLKGGYLEFHVDSDLQDDGIWVRRKPGQFLYRPAEWSHNVVTPFGVSWSLVLTGPKEREWGFHGCHD